MGRAAKDNHRIAYFDKARARPSLVEARSVRAVRRDAVF